MPSRHVGNILLRPTQNLILILIYAFGIAARMPEILMKGRFWAEEGATYFQNGRTMPWYDALFAVHTGYLNLAASIAGCLAAHVVPIEYAPWISTSVALLFQLCPILIIITADVAWLRPFWARCVASLVVLLTTPAGEVWLNSITSQFHLALCAALILAFPVRGGFVGWFRAAILALGALSGPASIFLTPLFWLRGYLEESWQRISQALVLTIIGLIQFAMVFMHPEPYRTIGIGPRLFVVVVYLKQMLLPLFGTLQVQFSGQRILGIIARGDTPWIPLIGGVIGMGAMAFVSLRNANVRWLFVAGATITVLSYFGALGEHMLLLNSSFGDRYEFVPNACFGLTLLGLACTTPQLWRILPALMVCGLIWTGAHEYTAPQGAYGTGPAWPAEVARWRADPSYRVQFWPPLDVWKWSILPNADLDRRAPAP
jgi:hypothetical protein